MNVRRIQLANFLRHTETQVDLPERGLVVVEGPNGAGKSSLVEAVAIGVWGKSIRGDAPWRTGTEGSVSVWTGDGPGAANVNRSDTMVVQRKRSAGGRTSVRWALQEQAETEYETTTKAQEALEAVVGSFDVWRRAQVFSSADAAHFTMATDGERKRLLEAVLGLGKFDDALERCRVDVRELSRLHLNLTSSLGGLLEKAAGLDRMEADAKAELAKLQVADQGDWRAMRDEAKQLDEMVAEAQDEIEDCGKKLRAGARQEGAAEAAVAALEEQLARLKHAECPSCGQRIHPEMRARAKVNLKDEEAKLRDIRSALKTDSKEVDAVIRELANEVRSLSTRAASLRTKSALAREAAERRANLESRVAQLCREASAARTKLDDRKDELKVVGADMLVLEAVERVLGLKGVRAHILGRTLGGIEAAANAWLSRIPGTVRAIRLSPYSEKKTGGVADAISIKIEGDGVGGTYKALSGGERRRVDAALLLALGDVAGGARGQLGGDLWVDELFDALDVQGQEAVARLLREISQSRKVVVITHSPQLVELLRPDLRLRVDGGKVDAA